MGKGALAPCPPSRARRGWWARCRFAHPTQVHNTFRLNLPALPATNCFDVDIFADDPAHREWIKATIKLIHLPSEETENGFRIYGYAQEGQAVDYL